MCIAYSPRSRSRQIHYVCDMDAPHVRAGIKANEDMFNMVNGMNGLAPTTTQIPDKEPGVTFPLAGSCAGCERDATAGARADLKKCSRCKLTRCAAPLRSYSLLRGFRRSELSGLRAMLADARPGPCPV